MKLFFLRKLGLSVGVNVQYIHGLASGHALEEFEGVLDNFDLFPIVPSVGPLFEGMEDVLGRAELFTLFLLSCLTERSY